MIRASMILDSIANGIRLPTIEFKAPKFLDAEFEKHRMISSNGSSDRAIPFLKALDRGYYLPEDVRLNQKGMQGDLLLDEDSKEEFWNVLKDIYGYTAGRLKAWDAVHKQHLNRYLMGFAWQHKIATATEWDNFFELRIDRAADPAMYQLAVAIKQAMDGSTPRELKVGEWHTPYCLQIDNIPERIQTSVAGVARVSYGTHDGTDRTLHKDQSLYARLRMEKHMTPFEGQATPIDYTVMTQWKPETWIKGVTHWDMNRQFWSANFKGWIQYRQLIQ